MKLSEAMLPKRIYFESTHAYPAWQGTNMYVQGCEIRAGIDWSALADDFRTFLLNGYDNRRYHNFAPFLGSGEAEELVSGLLARTCRVLSFLGLGEIRRFRSLRKQKSSRKLMALALTRIPHVQRIVHLGLARGEVCPQRFGIIIRPEPIEKMDVSAFLPVVPSFVFGITLVKLKEVPLR